MAVGVPAPLSGVVEQGSIRRIVKRAKHARHIPQRRVLQSPITEGTEGLPFKVEDDHLVACIENLPQVVVAVTANTQSRDFSGKPGAQTQADLFFQTEDSLRLGTDCFR